MGSGGPGSGGVGSGGMGSGSGGEPAESARTVPDGATSVTTASLVPTSTVAPSATRISAR